MYDKLQENENFLHQYYAFSGSNLHNLNCREYQEYPDDYKAVTQSKVCTLRIMLTQIHTAHKTLFKHKISITTGNAMFLHIRYGVIQLGNNFKTFVHF